MISLPSPPLVRPVRFGQAPEPGMKPYVIELKPDDQLTQALSHRGPRDRAVVMQSYKERIQRFQSKLDAWLTEKNWSTAVRIGEAAWINMTLKVHAGDAVVQALRAEPEFADDLLKINALHRIQHDQG